MRELTRGERANHWIELYCVTPNREEVQLTPEQRAAVYALYDAGVSAPITGVLAAYLTLLHIAGPEARPVAREPRELLNLQTDVFSVWNAASLRLREHLQRRGDRVVCPGLGTCWPAPAAA